MHPGIGGIGFLCIGEVAEIAVEVDVVLVDPAQVRETVRVDGVNQQHRDSACHEPADHVVVIEQRALAARAAEPFDAVRARRDDQERRRIGNAEDHRIGGEFFALRALERVDDRFDREPAALRGGKEPGARLGVGRGEIAIDIVHAA